MVRVKLKAAAIHAIFTIAVACLTALLVFGLWYPGRLSEMMGGSELYQLVILVELGLGPLISLVIYNPDKNRSELIRDYSIVALIQLSALGYGLYAVSISRPAFLVFVKDRIEIVAASELLPEDLVAATVEDYRVLPKWGPIRVCYQSPEDPSERAELLFLGAAGKDVHLMPKYYRECDDGEILAAAKMADVLLNNRVTYQPEIESLLDQEFLWLPAHNRKAMWTEVYPEGNLGGAFYVNIDPFLD